MNLPSLTLAKRLITAAHQLVTAVDVDTKRKGVMIALEIPKKVGKKLEIEDGEPTEDMHITIIYVGKMKEDIDAGGVDKLKSILTALAAQTPPLKGVLGGYGRFSGEDTDVFHATVDIPGLSEFRAKIVEDIKATPGLSFKGDHGYSPHVTLQYMEDKTAPNPEVRLKPVKVSFDEFVLKAGEDTTVFQFTGK